MKLGGTIRSPTILTPILNNSTFFFDLFIFSLGMMDWHHYKHSKRLNALLVLNWKGIFSNLSFKIFARIVLWCLNDMQVAVQVLFSVFGYCNMGSKREWLFNWRDWWCTVWRIEYVEGLECEKLWFNKTVHRRVAS